MGSVTSKAHCDLTRIKFRNKSGGFVPKFKPVWDQSEDQSQEPNFSHYDQILRQKWLVQTMGLVAAIATFVAGTKRRGYLILSVNLQLLILDFYCSFSSYNLQIRYFSFQYYRPHKLFSLILIITENNRCQQFGLLNFFARLKNAFPPNSDWFGKTERRLIG